MTGLVAGEGLRKGLINQDAGGLVSDCRVIFKVFSNDCNQLTSLNFGRNAHTKHDLGEAVNFVSALNTRSYRHQGSAGHDALPNAINVANAKARSYSPVGVIKFLASTVYIVPRHILRRPRPRKARPQRQYQSKFSHGTLSPSTTDTRTPTHALVQGGDL